jgi:adenosylcobinamide-phosphate synthase
VALAAGLDRLVGDPRSWLHPVQVMGWLIGRLRGLAESWAGDHPRRLRLAGVLITVLLVGGSGLAGWQIERLAIDSRGPLAWLGAALLLIGLASALAARSLATAVRAVSSELAATGPEALANARALLGWIVGREVDRLGPGEILRAAAETAAENAVDGLFAPLFWMLVGAALWHRWPQLPGPLALAWGFKASSTLDSMLGYRRGRLRWLGCPGARLDDLLTWLPCRLVAASLPLAAGRPGQTLALLQLALVEGAADPSPNAGVSQAAYAHCARVRLGGPNHYPGGRLVDKPLLARAEAAADGLAVERILGLSDRLELIWLLAALGLGRLAGS